MSDPGIDFSMSLTWWDFDTSPVGEGLLTQDSSGKTSPASREHYPAEVLARLSEIANQVDEAECEGNGCGWNPTLQEMYDPSAVGYVISAVGDTDQVEWLWTSIVRLPDGHLRVVCEDCSPTLIYDLGADASRALAPGAPLAGGAPLAADAPHEETQ